MRIILTGESLTDASQSHELVRDSGMSGQNQNRLKHTDPELKRTAE